MKCYAMTWVLVVSVSMAHCAGVLAGGAAIENDKIKVSGDAGKGGLTVSSKQSDNKFELRLIGENGNAAVIKSVSAGKSDDEGKSLKVVTDGGEALVTLGTGRSYAEIKPVKGLKGTAVAMPSRFALMPDFFAMDVVLDARRCKQDKATGLADNFYLVPIDGGNGVVFCVWPGVDTKDQTREESPVELIATGDGEARKFSESRVSFPGTKPVYVALLEGTNYWRLEESASWDLSQPVKIKWQRPFDGRWRASFMAKEGKTVSGWGVTILSFYFPDLRNKRNGWVQDENLNSAVGWTDRFGSDVPEGASQGLGHYAHPCWFKEKDTYLYPPLNPGGDKRAADDYNNMEKKLAEKAKRDGRQYTIYVHTVENIYDGAIIYPLQRSKSTPLDVTTPADVVKQTLGVGPCEYILDKEGAVWAFHGGTNKMHYETATCAIWDQHLNPLLNEWKSKGGTLDDTKKQNMVWMIEDMGTFVAAVNKRIHVYDDFLKAVKGLCEAAKQKGSKEDAALAAALDPDLKAMQGAIGNVAGFDKGLAEWQDKLAKLVEIAKAADSFKPELTRAGDVRGFAEPQDNTIAGCRRCVNMIKQKAGLAINESGAASASLAAKIREECRKVLRNPHPLEHF
ncbi:MAG: hypothetical protein C0404_08205 [Verrucomicrobia bacterium]|nr:hypothetical protein [Verrucomicrobiota bacterium]